MRSEVLKKHLFLTGEKGSGKSTLIKRVCDNLDGRAGGFVTVKTDKYLKEKNSVHIFPVQGDRLPTTENFLFVCGDGKDCSARFDTIAADIIFNSKKSDYIIMDEIGPNEKNALRFQQAIFETLDGDGTVIGVLQKADSDFLRNISTRDDVEVFYVTGNHDEDVRLFEATIKKFINDKV